MDRRQNSESGQGEGSFDLNVTIHGVGGNLAEDLEMGRVRISLSGGGNFVILGIKVRLVKFQRGY